MKVRLQRRDPGSVFASGSNSAVSRRMAAHRHWQASIRAERCSRRTWDLLNPRSAFRVPEWLFERRDRGEARYARWWAELLIVPRDSWCYVSARHSVFGLMRRATGLTDRRSFIWSWNTWAN